MTRNYDNPMEVLMRFHWITCLIRYGLSIIHAGQIFLPVLFVKGQFVQLPIIFDFRHRLTRIREIEAETYLSIRTE